MTALPDNVIAFPQADSDPALEQPRVEPGTYAVIYVRHERIRIFGKPGKLTPKLRIDFQLAAHPDIIVPSWYRIRDWQQHGRISAGKSSKLVRDMQAALGKRIRSDRIPIADLKGRYVTAIIRDVTRDHEQHELDSINQYSVVDRLTAIPA